jgi:hypothetical protein
MKANYVRLPQTYDGSRDVRTIPDVFKFEAKPDLWWGTTIYLVMPDGSLKYLEDDVDSSD